MHKKRVSLELAEAGERRAGSVISGNSGRELEGATMLPRRFYSNPSLRSHSTSTPTYFRLDLNA